MIPMGKPQLKGQLLRTSTIIYTKKKYKTIDIIQKKRDTARACRTVHPNEHSSNHYLNNSQNVDFDNQTRNILDSWKSLSAQSKTFYQVVPTQPICFGRCHNRQLIDVFEENIK